MASGVSDSDRGKLYVELYTRYHRRLYLYVLTLVPCRVEAEEIVQQTNAILWEKFDRFQHGTNFFAWACRTARFEVLKYRERRHRREALFSDELIDTLAAETERSHDLLERQSDALALCLKKLPERDRELLELRYIAGASTQSTAEQAGRSVDTVYKALNRIRRTLFECVRQSLALEGQP